MPKNSFSFHRRKQLEVILGVGRSTVYNMLADGVLTPPVNIGLRSVGWPSYEIDEILAARIAGKPVDEIKTLVSKLVAARQLAA